MDKHERWRRLDALLNEALVVERDRIPSDYADQVNLVAVFIDANEFGLAFDQLEYLIYEAGLTFTETGAAAMALAADLMGISRTGPLGRACS